MKNTESGVRNVAPYPWAALFGFGFGRYKWAKAYDTFQLVEPETGRAGRHRTGGAGAAGHGDVAAARPGRSLGRLVARALGGRPPGQAGQGRKLTSITTATVVPARSVRSPYLDSVRTLLSSGEP